MISQIVVVGALICVVLCSWNLAQQNVIGKEPFARVIGLSYAAMSLGAVSWLLAPILPFGDIGVPLFVASLAVNLGMVSLRLSRLYE